jgi:hypothetical protein
VIRAMGPVTSRMMVSYSDMPSLRRHAGLDPASIFLARCH